MAMLTLMGLYTWNEHLFDDMSYPADFTDDDKNTLMANLFMDCAELEVIYPNWDWMKMAIGAWSAKELPTWERLYEAMNATYNPIENYNRTEDSTVSHSGAITHSGIDTNAATGQDSDAHTGYQTIAVGKIPAIILVRDGSLIPHAPLAQRTDEIDWSKVELKPYKAAATTCTGLLFKPGDTEIQTITQ